MSEQEIREMNELDDLAEKFGGYVCTEIPDALHYDYRKIIEYCRKMALNRSILQFVKCNPLLFNKNIAGMMT